MNREHSIPNSALTWLGAARVVQSTQVTEDANQAAQSPLRRSAMSSPNFISLRVPIERNVLSFPRLSEMVGSASSVSTSGSTSLPEPYKAFDFDVAEHIKQVREREEAVASGVVKLPQESRVTLSALQHLIQQIKIMKAAKPISIHRLLGLRQKQRLSIELEPIFKEIIAQPFTEARRSLQLFLGLDPVIDELLIFTSSGDVIDEGELRERVTTEMSTRTELAGFWNVLNDYQDIRGESVDGDVDGGGDDSEFLIEQYAQLVRHYNDPLAPSMRKMHLGCLSSFIQVMSHTDDYSGSLRLMTIGVRGLFDQIILLRELSR